MLTETAKLTIFFLLVGLLIAFYTQVELIFFICAVLSSLLFVSFVIYKITQITKIKCNRIMPSAVYEGQNVEVALALENQSVFASFFVELIDNFSPELPNKQQKKLLFPYLSRRAVIKITYEGHCAKRGVYWVGPP
ncbi:MAG: hypothetical protein PHF11_05515 [Candidatus Omnitrophica bacterium]|nr:hypothetical protein [Candidatus Omnitrophota bacterium]